MVLRTALLCVLLTTACVHTSPATNPSSVPTISEQAVDVREGEDAVLRCRFDPSVVSDDSTFYWSQRSIHGWDNVAIRDSKFNRRYRVDFNTQLGQYDLHISGATYSRDNGQYACTVRQVNSGELLHTQPVNLTVLQRPQPPLINPLPDRQLQEGGVLQLRCSSTGGSPSPQVLWYRQREAAGGQDELLEQYQQLEAAADRSQPTVATLKLVLDKRDDGARLYCAVWNRAMEKTEKLTTNIKLDVNYSPRITVGPSDPLHVEEGSSVAMHCNVDAKPPAERVFWSGGDEGNVLSAGRVLQMDQVQVKDAGTYTCSASNSVGESRKSLQLAVQYRPRVTSQPSLVEADQHENVEVQCRVDANPQADEVYWIRTGRSEFRQAGSTLHLPAISLDQAGEYVCVAISYIATGSGQRVMRQGNTTAVVAVRHSPGPATVLMLTPSETLTPTSSQFTAAAVEGRPMTLACISQPAGYPAPHYRWWHKTTGPTRQQLVTPGSGNFSVASVRIGHRGEYVCQAENRLGSGASGSLSVDILRPPHFVIKNQPDVTRSVSATSQFHLSCSADGYPTPSVTWLKGGVDVLSPSGGEEAGWYSVTTVPDKEGGGRRSRLNFAGPQRVGGKLTADDRGNYTCRFSSVAGVIEATTSLKIQHLPIVHHTYHRVAFDIGQTAVIRCQMQANPKPQFHWTFRGVPVGERIDGVHSKTDRALASDIYQSALTVSTVEQRHYGDYMCHASNEEGQRNTELTLQPKSGPEPPLKLHVTVREANWALVDWTPGFDGGFSDTEYHMSLLDASGRERAVGCGQRRPCNVTDLDPNSIYRIKVRAENERAISQYSEQLQFSTWPLVSSLQPPSRVQFDPEQRHLAFDITNTPDSMVAIVEISGDERGEVWQVLDSPVELQSDRVSVLLPVFEQPVNQMQVRLCVRDNLQVCGAAVSAERVPAGSMVAPSVSMPLTTVVIIAVTLVVMAALCVIVFICCCRRGNRKLAKHNSSTYTKNSLPAYLPPGVSAPIPSTLGRIDIDDKMANSAQLTPTDTNGKALYAGANSVFDYTSVAKSVPMAPSYTPGTAVPGSSGTGGAPPASGEASGGSGSLNSQDSLWQVKSSCTDVATVCSTVPLPHGYHPGYSQHPGFDPQHGYDPAQANYQPDSVAIPPAYGDYGHYPTDHSQYQQQQLQNLYSHQEYGQEVAGYHQQTAALAPPTHHHHHNHNHHQPHQQQQQQQQYPVYNQSSSDMVDHGYSEQQQRRTGPTFDISLESGLSTPTSRNRRVIREVVV